MYVQFMSCVCGEHVMSHQGNVRHSNSATSLFFEWSKSDKALTETSKRPIEETENPAIVINALEKTEGWDYCTHAIIAKRKR